jgi:hypothetical protein
VCKSKKKGELGVEDLRKLNISLLVKWWWLLETGKSLWQEIVKIKYVKKTPYLFVSSEIQ